MEKPSIFQRILSHARQLLPHLGVASTAPGAGQNAPNTSAFSSSSIRYTATELQVKADLLQKEYRKQLGEMFEDRVNSVYMHQYLSKYKLSLRQYEILKFYGLPVGHVSTFDWTLFGRYSPDEFREAFPEYYV